MISLKLLFKKVPVIVSWIISYTTILLLPFIICIFVYVQAYTTISHQLTDYNITMLNQMRTHMDEKLVEINDFATKVSLVPNMHILMNFTNESELYKNFDYIQRTQNLSKSLELYKPYTAIVKNCYLFFPKSKQVWFASNFYNKDLFFSANIRKEISEVDWDYLNGYFGTAYSITRLDSQSSGSAGALMLLYPIFVENGSPKATLAVSINEANTISYMRQISRINEGTVSIVSNQNEILLSTTSKNEQLSYILKSKQLKNGKMNHIKVDGKKFAVYSIPSDVYSVKYISIIPEKVISKQLIYIQNVMLASALLCIVFGCLLIIMLVKRNYSPVRQLVATVTGNSSNKNKPHDQNEYQFIHGALIDVYEKNKSLEQRMQIQDTSLRSNYLNRLLHGKISFCKLNQDIFESFEFSANSNNFVVIICYLDGKDNGMNKYDELMYDDYLNFFEENFSPLIKKHFVEGYSFTCTEIDEFIACIIGIDDSCLPQWKNNIYEALAASTQEVEKQNGLRYVFATSKVYQDFNYLPVAFDDAMMAMEYRIFDCETIVLFEEDMVHNDRSVFSYTVNEEQKLINCIRTADLDKGTHLINFIFENFAQSEPSATLIKCFVCDVASTFIKVLEQDKFLQKENGEIILKSIADVTNQKSIDKMRNKLLVCLTEICGVITEEKPKSNGYVLAQKIDLLIENNLHNVSLGVSFLSDQINLNSRYLSSLYKEERGDSIMDNIHKRRIAEFKILITDKNLGVGDAAKAVGYCSTNTLIRWFKKYEGITPGQLKRLK